MKLRIHLLLLFSLFASLSLTFAQGIADNYLLKWKQFYPSQSTRSGFRSSIFEYENRSQSAIDEWVAFNRETLRLVADTTSDYFKTQRSDARLLRVQVQSEIDEWVKLKVHENQLRMYLQVMANAIPPVLEADYLTSPEKYRLINDRLSSIQAIAISGKANLRSVTQQDLDNSKRQFNALFTLLAELPKKMEDEHIISDGIEENLEKTRASLVDFQSYVDKTLGKSIIATNEIIGREEYARRLALYTDSNLTPEELAEIALKEIQTVRGLIENVSKSYLYKMYPGDPIPGSTEQVTQKALDDMEKDVPLNASDYEQFWNELLDAAISFIKEKDIATLPEHQTLSIQSAPESAGPRARIGWVASAPPFDPNPWTTLFLPSIPETVPEQEQKDFWASFNKPFNRMIVIHELIPGHYMQLKVSRQTAHPLRLLFPFGIFIEGWATFCERVALDAGWEAGNDLTMLAHLRKRIENANRAYTSVMVHCNGWSQEQVMKFSTETSLVAPQFASSLWFRLMSSPMQLTSYFLGGSQFTALLNSEKARLGNRFNLKLFMDTIMRAGPIPIDEFYSIFAQTIPD